MRVHNSQQGTPATATYALAVTHTLCAFLCLFLLESVYTVCRADVENFGVRNDYDIAFQELLKDREVLRIEHPMMANRWAKQFMYRYGFDIHPNAAKLYQRQPVPPSSGPYPDKRMVVFRFFPGKLSLQAGTGALLIRQVSRNPETGIVTLKTRLCSEFRTMSRILVSFPCTDDQWHELLLLYKSLRLRVLMKCRILRVKGVRREGKTFLDPIIDDVSLSILDVTTPFLSPDKVSVMPDTSTQTDRLLNGTEPKEETELDTMVSELIEKAAPEEDPDTKIGVPEKPLRVSFDAASLEDLPYSEGLQPFNRGWYLKDAFPKQNAEVIAICNQTELPASFTVKLNPPLPPGLYKVSLRSTYYRSRFFDNILRIKLGDDEVEVAYWHPWFSFQGSTNDWLECTGLRTTVPTDEITFTACQIGGGDRAQAPPYFRRWIAFDRFFITNVMNDRDGQHLYNKKSNE